MFGKNKSFFLTSILSVFLFIFFAENSSAATARLSWTANSESDLAGYKIYYGTSARTGTKPSDANQGGYPNVVDAQNSTSYTINNISNTGTTYFSVVAYDTSSNQSVFSTEVKKKPGNVNLDQDANGIGIVNSLDVVLIINCLGQAVAEGCQNTDVDVNNSINSLDIMGVINNFGNTN